jgi:hypothetical protein
VTTPAGVVAFAAQTGGGKTSLVVECLRRGARLFADDVVALEARDGRVAAHPGPPLMNVPARLGAGAVAGARRLADFGDEHWVCLEDAATPTPAPLAAIVLLSRAPDLPLRCAPVQASSLTLLPHAISLPHMPPGARERFEVFSHLAATPVLSLTAEPSVTPAGLADAVETRVPLR